MAQIEKTAKLVRLSDTELTIANPAEDIRGRAVVDRDGEELGEVEGLLIDAPEEHVHWLEAASGGFLGGVSRIWQASPRQHGHETCHALAADY